ncbi:MAG: hypothetical protein WC343_05495 [Bacilli bacterium]
MVRPKRDPNTPLRCSTEGCTNSPMWEIEIRGSGAECTLYYSCTEHCREWRARLGPEDSMQYLGETLYDRTVAQAEEYRAMRARGIDPDEF